MNDDTNRRVPQTNGRDIYITSRVKNEARLKVRVSDLCFLECFDPGGGQTHKTPILLIPRVSANTPRFSCEQVTVETQGETDGELANPGSSLSSQT